MRIVIDENMSSHRLAAQLRAAGHDIVLAQDVGLQSASDARVLTWAVGPGLLVLTRDHEDYTDLHQLVQAVSGQHPGILVVRFDNDPRHNLSERGIATALRKLEASAVVLANQIHVLNQWR